MDLFFSKYQRWNIRDVADEFVTNDDFDDTNQDKPTTVEVESA